MLIPRQQAVRDEVKVFAEKYMYPVSEELDRMPEPRKFPLDLYRKIGEAGFIGYVMPTEYGGRGKSNLEYITLDRRDVLSRSGDRASCALSPNWPLTRSSISPAKNTRRNMCPTAPPASASPRSC